MLPSTPEFLSTEAAQAESPARKIAVIVRSTIFNVLFYVNVLVLMIVGLPMCLMGRRAGIFMARAWAKTSLWLLRVVCGTKVEYRGAELVPPGGGIVIAPKHQSILETFALVPMVPDFAYVFKRELNWIPLFGWYLMAVDQIAIDRSSGATALTQVPNGTDERLRAGRSVFIFPEGTRRPIGAPPRYKHGVTHLYATLDVPVMPVALNTGLFWPRRSFLRKPGVAVIEFLPIIQPGLPREEFAALLQSTIETRSDALVAEALRQDASLLPSTGAQSGANA
jgi:1-acyl-sn-glycerol-3-phosphate acyltransferase